MLMTLLIQLNNCPYHLVIVAVSARLFILTTHMQFAITMMDIIYQLSLLLSFLVTFDKSSFPFLADELIDNG